MIDEYLHSWNIGVKAYPHVEANVDRAIAIVDAVARDSDPKKARAYKIIRDYFFTLIEKCVQTQSDPAIYKKTFLGAAESLLKL